MDLNAEHDRVWREAICSNLGLSRFLPPGFPTITCLCGSTRFKPQFIEANYRLTMAGHIVLTVGWFSHADAQVYAPTPGEKSALDELHLRKIDLCDEVFVVNPGGYVGESTRNEIAHAKRMGKPVRYLEG